MTELPPLAYPGVVAFPAGPNGRPELVGGFCPACNRHYFPRPRWCPRCLAEPAEALLGSEGALYTYTVVRVRPPLGLPAPYGLGYVDLPGSGLRVFALLDPERVDELEVGLPVELAVASLGHDGHGSPRRRPYFTPVRSNGDRENG